MRPGRFHTLPGTAGLVDDHRFASRNFSGDLEKGASVLEPLHINHHGVRVWIVAEEPQIFVKLNVPLVSDADEGGKPACPLCWLCARNDKATLPDCDSTPSEPL